MRRVIRFVTALVLGLGFVTWIASAMVQSTTRDWFEKDMALRAQLAINGARQTLVSHWTKQEFDLLRTSLDDIARDERIMAAAACSADLRDLARTTSYPSQFTCAGLAQNVRQEHDVASSPWRSWNGRAVVPGGNVYLSAIPVLDGDEALGFITLVHDLTFVERREGRTTTFLLFAFVFLALAASGVTVNALAPGYIETPLTAGELAKPGKRADLESLVPAGRLGTPDELTGPALFLSSRHAGFITGHVMYIDGGRTLV
jgi:hypothetical protein